MPDSCWGAQRGCHAVQECDRLEALLETAREGNAQQASEQLESLHADLASLRQQLMSSEEQVQVLEQDLQVYILRPKLYKFKACAVFTVHTTLVLFSAYRALRRRPDRCSLSPPPPPHPPPHPPPSFFNNSICLHHASCKVSHLLAEAEQYICHCCSLIVCLCLSMICLLG